MDALLPAAGGGPPQLPVRSFDRGAASAPPVAAPAEGGARAPPVFSMTGRGEKRITSADEVRKELVLIADIWPGVVAPSGAKLASEATKKVYQAMINEIVESLGTPGFKRISINQTTLESTLRLDWLEVLVPLTGTRRLDFSQARCVAMDVLEFSSHDGKVVYEVDRQVGLWAAASLKPVGHALKELQEVGFRDSFPKLIASMLIMVEEKGSEGEWTAEMLLRETIMSLSGGEGDGEKEDGATYLRRLRQLSMGRASSARLQ